MAVSQKYLVYHAAITLISIILFIPFLGSVHLFDWDEINFAECAREMIVSHNYSIVQINFQPFWEKPPLFIWLQVISMKLFGINEFAARLPNAVCGIITLNLTYYLGRKYNNHTFGILWTLCFGASFLPFLYFKSGIIDPWFNLFIFLSICFLLQWVNNTIAKKNNLNALLAGLFAGLAVLTKGPPALLIIGLTFLISWIRLKFNPFHQIKNLLLFFITASVIGFSWFIFEIVTGHSDIVKEFIIYQVRLFNTHDAGHEGFFLYHFVVLLVGCFPASIFLIRAHKKNLSDTPFQGYVKKWMLHLFWVVLILFSLVGTKIVHYSSMCYFPLTYLAAYTLHDMIYTRRQLHKAITTIGIFLISVLGLAFIMAGFIPYFIPMLTKSNLIADKFAVASLQAPVTWYGFEWIIGVFFLIFSLYFFINLHKNKKHLYGLFATSLISIWMITLFIVPKIEPYSQGPAIEFYQSLKDKDCYVETIGFKSYAYLFYTNRQPNHNTPQMVSFIKGKEQEIIKNKSDNFYSFSFMSLSWMLDEPTDKTAYFAAKITDTEDIKKNHQDLIELYHKGGFVFYKRLPKQ